MAHIGKLGPVVFRRDFNLNVNNNRDGWYRRFIVTLFGLPPGDANILNGRPFDCGPEEYSDTRTILWSSGFVLQPVFQFNLELRIQINDGKTYLKQGFLFQKPAGLIWEWRWIEGDNAPYPNFDSFSQVSTEFYNPEWFDSPPNQVRAICQRKSWAAGPPH